jgi:uncharacterized protein YbjT (DUF2867 family)
MPMKTILLTGATGFVGRRLLYSLLNEDVNIRLLVRNKKKLENQILERCQIFEGDTFNIPVLMDALNGVDVAVYLIHMMGKDENYLEKEKESAENFRVCCERNGIKQIIYLGGLGGDLENTSIHLKSRFLTGKILSKNPEKAKVAWFRAGVIIGSGSASFEIIRHLVEKLPIMIAPKWVDTETCPIYINDVIEYLKAAILNKNPIHDVIDIGMQPMTFKQMLIETAQVLGLKRIVIKVPLLTPRISSYWLILLTPVNYQLARELVLGLKTRTVKTNDNAEKYFPHIKITHFKEAIKKALEEIERDLVLSRWCDSAKDLVSDVPKIPEISKAVYIDTYIKQIDKSYSSKIFYVCKNIGGEKGWYALNFLWEIRGLIDKILGGYGTNIGRRSTKEVRVGDFIGFWKVIDIVEDKRLLLEAQMKLPGKAWLEFSINGETFTQTVYFYPKGLFGRLYWYSLLPFHKLIFKMMINKIIEEAKKLKDLNL